MVGGLELPEPLLELRDLAVAQLGGTLQVGIAFGALGLGALALERLLDFAHAPDRVLLGLPLRLHRRRALLEVGELTLDRLTALARRIVLLLGHRLVLDLELHDPPLDLVDLDRKRVDLDAQLRGRLVDQVDRLVGQKAVGDVAMAESRRRDDRAVGDAHPVVHLVALLQPAQDRDRVLDRGLADHDRLEAALERGVLLDVLAVLVERRRTDGTQLAPGEHRLEQVGGVDGTLGGAGADDRVQLVHEEDHRAARVGDLLEDGLEPVLELAAVLRAGDQRADVQRDHATVAQRFGHVTGDDALGEALDDRRLADAGLADQHGVVLRAPAEHLDHAPDLVVAADHRVEPALLGELREVTPEALQRLELVLGALVGHAVGAAYVGERLEQALLRGAAGTQGVARLAAVAGEREQQVLGGHVVVAELAHLVLCGAQHRDEVIGGAGRSVGSGEDGQCVERGVELAADGVRRDAELGQRRPDDTLGRLEHDGEQVLRGHLRVAAPLSQALRSLDGLLGLDRESICVHWRASYISKSNRLRS